MTATTPVLPGTAEQLARIARFRDLEQTQPEELDAVAYFLIGPVGGPLQVAQAWDAVRDDCRALWHLITDDWDEYDLDELTEADCLQLPLCATEEQQNDRRYEITRARLAQEIEQTIRLARYSATQARRATRQAVAS